MIARANKGEHMNRIWCSRTSFTAACFLLLMAGTVAAGMVSGEIRDGGKVLKGAEIEVKDSKNNHFRVKTDQNGKYTVNLPPGIYRASITNDKSKGELILQSSPQPSRQDLDFGKR